MRVGCSRLNLALAKMVCCRPILSTQCGCRGSRDVPRRMLILWTCNRLWWSGGTSSVPHTKKKGMREKSELVDQDSLLSGFWSAVCSVGSGFLFCFRKCLDQFEKWIKAVYLELCLIDCRTHSWSGAWSGFWRFALKRQCGPSSIVWIVWSGFACLIFFKGGILTQSGDQDLEGETFVIKIPIRILHFF